MKKTWTEDEIALMAEKAAGMHATGCNCAQSVFLMFAEEGGLDKETARKLLQGFGGGLAVGEVCGALSGAVAAYGLLSDPVPPGDFAAKMAFSEKTKALAEAFKEGAGALRCEQLRPEDMEARRAVCGGYIQLGVKLAAEALMK